MKKVLSFMLVAVTIFSSVCLSGCDNGLNIVQADPAQLIDSTDACVTVQESGDYTYHPSEETIGLDSDEGVLYFNNLITVFLTESLPSYEVQELLDHVGGELVGLTRNGVNTLEIKVEESPLSELKAKAESLCEFDCVLFSDYDFPIVVSDAALTNDPWTSGDTPIQGRGDEDNPDGNDWWAEAVGAYTAWELCEDISEKTKVAVIDNGINYNHEELSAVSNYGNYPFNAEPHGTSVTGIIAAESDNETGIRGIAAENSEVEFFDILVKGKNYFSSNEWVSIFSSLVTSGNKVINLSMAVGTLYTKDEFDKHIYVDIVQGGEETDNWYDGILAKLFELSVGKFYYDDYLEYFTKYTEKSSKTALNLIANLLYNGFDDFIFVQCAGNGYNGTTGDPGCYDYYSGSFAGINEELFYSLPQKSRQRLWDKGIDFDAIANHKIIVAATGKPDSYGNYSLTSWSSFGYNVDICAPGEEIYHCPSYDTINAWDNSFYDEFMGTSAAAPIVSAGVALTWAAFPDASAATIKSLITENATTAYGGSSNEDPRALYPMLNIGKSVEAALPERVVLNPTEEETENEYGEASVYSEIISAYKTAAENNFFNGDYDACGDINPELWLSAHRNSDLVYALVDLCNDGEPELIIAALNSKYSGGYQIYDIWGQENGVPARLFDTAMGYRAIYSVTDNNSLMKTYSHSETWGETGYEYTVWICYNNIYSLTPNSTNVVFTEGFKREILDGEAYCYYADETGNETNPFYDDDYSYFETLTGVTWNEINYNPGRNLEWITIHESIKSN